MNISLKPIQIKILISRYILFILLHIYYFKHFFSKKKTFQYSKGNIGGGFSLLGF